MGFYKNVKVDDLTQKYGFSQKGLVAQEVIKKGERIWSCNCGEKDISFTRDQLLDIIKKHPRLDYFVRSFSYMIDDDIYAMPVTFMEEKNNDECAYFNHSCNPNCGYEDGALADSVIAHRDIQPGEELTIHYGYLETESSLIFGLQCKCDSINCVGRITFDFYRDDDFVEKCFDCMTDYLRQKVRDMRERWYTKKCYVKRYPPEIEKPIEEWQKGLYTLDPIKKGELVAVYSQGHVALDKHFIRHSEIPSCYLNGLEVYASVDLPPETEITLNFN
jgi:SET domain-containing protein